MFGYTLRVAIERTNGTLGICEFVFSNVRISCKKKKTKNTDGYATVDVFIIMIWLLFSFSDCCAFSFCCLRASSKYK